MRPPPYSSYNSLNSPFHKGGIFKIPPFVKENYPKSALLKKAVIRNPFFKRGLFEISLFCERESAKIPPFSKEDKGGF
ncbi:hypothetical protein AMJ44_15465 [candidate division WOR-1 bacterium DG_54_3]|uniref:Uncharacterized protein n=1 Tax=candidate division WOR-1 bacterium DG_54_3 TaxID=1703775 RepID=A0A0S7XJZ9_UNCSA|nr:MAG: hypothetical protein AMJ44_15465 [candidate division WOR-1 bacterium DG_54_3]